MGHWLSPIGAGDIRPVSSSRSRAAGERLPHAESAQLLQRCLSEAPPIDLSKKPFVCVQPDSSCLFSLVGRNEYYYVFVTATTTTTLFDLFFQSTAQIPCVGNPISFNRRPPNDQRRRQSGVIEWIKGGGWRSSAESEIK